MQVSTISGRRFQHRVMTHGRGESPPVLMLHGFLGDMFSWQYCVVPLARQGRVVALDLPAHGQCAQAWSGGLDGLTDWLEDALDALQLSRCHILAHSFGAWIALQAALRFSDRIASLSLVACAGLDRHFNFPLLRDALQVDEPAAALRYAQMLAGRSCDSVPRLARHHLEQLADAPRRSMLLSMLEDMIAAVASQAPSRLDWDRLTVPVRFFWSRNDRIVPMPDRLALPAQPDLMLNDEGGHVPHILVPTWLTAGVSDFLDSLQRQTA
jgi:pimeloyl-ACP methyl ester carboxylesterase